MHVQPTSIAIWCFFCNQSAELDLPGGTIHETTAQLLAAEDAETLLVVDDDGAEHRWVQRRLASVTGCLSVRIQCCSDCVTNFEQLAKLEAKQTTYPVVYVDEQGNQRSES